MSRAALRLRRGSGPAIALAAAAAIGAGCAYFNALYNAEQEFEDAERYAAAGERSRADQAYLRSARKAAKSFEQDPEGRWADDALYLLGRAHFQRGSFPEAGASLRRLLTVTDDAEIRAGARALLGATELRLGDPDAALEHLEAVLADDDLPRNTRALALLWRGRTRSEAGDAESAWEDLVASAELGGPTERAARLETVRAAVRAGDADRVGPATAALVDGGHADALADSLFALADSADALWGAAFAGALLQPLEEAPWPDDRRAALFLTRAGLAASAGDTARAIEHALEAAARSAGPNATRARLEAARWTLATGQEVDELRQVRGVLLPALASPSARDLVRRIEVVGLLVETGLSNNEPIALFTAGEIARDELHAPGIARAIFLGQAEQNVRSPWAMKAALAAAQLGPTADQQRRIDAMLANATGDPYLAAARGEPSERYAQLEDRLGALSVGLRRWGREEAERRDGLVLQTVLTMDSLRTVEVLDSMSVVCAAVMDSLGIATGPSADSVGVDARVFADSAIAACVRSDSLRLDSLVSGALDVTPDSAAADSLDADSADGFPDDTTSGGGGQSGEGAGAPGVAGSASDADGGAARAESHAEAVLRIGGLRPAP
jgi:predicted negative regulator of RcsB-dependent stress response